MAVYTSICPVCDKEYRNIDVESRTHCSVGCQFGEREDVKVQSLLAKVASQEAVIAALGKSLERIAYYAYVERIHPQDAFDFKDALREATSLQRDRGVTRAIALEAARREVCEAAESARDVLLEFRSADPSRRGEPSSLTLNMHQAEQGLAEALARLAELEAKA